MKDKTPFFSIIIPTHNRPGFLHKSVNSVLNQKYQSFEIIVVNDASTEDYSDTEKFLKSDSRIRYYKVDFKNRSKTRNFGIDKAIGDWICFLDDDDIYYDNHLEILYNNILEYPDIKIFRTLTVTLINNKKDFDRDKGVEIQNHIQVIRHMLPIHSFTVNKKLLINNRFIDFLHYMEDTELWLRLIKANKLKIIPKHTNEYIVHGKNTVSDNDENTLLEKEKAINYIIKTYPQIQKKDFNNKLYQLSLALCTINFDNKVFKQALHYYINAIKIKPQLLISRWTLGKLKRLLNE